MKELFFELIQSALGKRTRLSRIPTDKEWYELYDEASKQALIGICFVGVETIHQNGQTPPIGLLMEWIGQTEKIKTRNVELNFQCKELRQKLLDDGFRSCILKGQLLAERYYQHLSLYRQSGDIDVWLDGGRKQIMQYVNHNSAINDVRWLHVEMPFFENTEVEIHFIPSYLECPWYNKKLQRFFDSKKHQCFNEGTCTDCFNQVYILAHAFRHLFGEGVGLRQLMDYYFVLKNSKTRIAREEFYSIMRDVGMIRFARALMWVLHEVFGLDEQYMLCNPSEVYGRLLLEEILLSGNFGHQDERIKHFSKDNSFKRFLQISLYNCRVFKFSPMTVLFSPFWRLWHWGWRRINSYK